MQDFHRSHCRNLIGGDRQNNRHRLVFALSRKTVCFGPKTVFSPTINIGSYNNRTCAAQLGSSELSNFASQLDDAARRTSLISEHRTEAEAEAAADKFESSALLIIIREKEVSARDKVGT